MLFTMRTIALAAIGLLTAVVMGATAASAQTISQTQRSGFTYSFIDSQPRFAQVLTAPNERLTVFTVDIDGFAATGAFVAEVYAWNGTALDGPALYSSGPNPVLVGANTYSFTPPADGVPVTTGQEYALVFTASGTNASFPFGSPDPEPSSSLWVSPSATATSLNQLVFSDAVFSATFAPASVAVVPTLSEWAMIVLGVMLAGGAALYIRQRRYIV